MARDHDELSRRPDRVIILDADDPLTEVHGEFVWRDEHECVLGEVRRQAYAEGFEAGRQTPVAPIRVELRRRRPFATYLRRGLFALAILLVLLMLPIFLT